jgi:hypothetical protein
MFASLIGKTVKINDLDLLSYFYPGFERREKITLLDSDKRVIYTGRMQSDLEKTLRIGTREFINTVGHPDVDLSDRESLLNFVYSKHGKSVPKSVLAHVDDLDDTDFLTSVKIVWVVGVWPHPISEEAASIYDLFQGSIGSTVGCLHTYFVLCELYPPIVLESSFLTFLLRAKNPDDQNVKPGYLKLLKTLYSQCGAKIKSAAMELAESPKVLPELRFVSLVMGLR